MCLLSVKEVGGEGGPSAFCVVWQPAFIVMVSDGVVVFFLCRVYDFNLAYTIYTYIRV